MRPPRVSLVLHAALVLAGVLLAGACATVDELEPAESLPEYDNYMALRGAGISVPHGWRFRPPIDGDSFETLYRFQDGGGTAYGSVEEQRTDQHDDDDFLTHVENMVLAPADRRHSLRLVIESETDSRSIPVVAARLVPGWELYTTSLPLGEARYVITVAIDTAAYDDPWVLFQSIVLSVSADNPDHLVRRFPGQREVRLSVRRRDWVGEDAHSVYFERDALGGEVRVGVHVENPGASWERVSEQTAVAVRPIDVSGEELFLSYTYPCLPEEGSESTPDELIDEVIDDTVAER